MFQVLAGSLFEATRMASFAPPCPTRSPRGEMTEAPIAPPERASRVGWIARVLRVARPGWLWTTRRTGVTLPPGTE